MERTYNIYCDESRVENRDSRCMVIGALFIPRKEKNRIVKDLNKIFQKHNFGHELKWVKTGAKKFEFYKDIIDYFFSRDGLHFRCIIVDKVQVDLERYHNNDEEMAFFKFYYFMLRNKLLSGNRYYIFLDKKPTREKRRAVALYSYLRSFILLNKEDCHIRHLQAYDSKNNNLIQLIDFLTGMVSYDCNENENKKSAKKKIINYAKQKLDKNSLCEGTPLSEDKFNVFVWDPGNGKS
jgi:hypothetical protein